VCASGWMDARNRRRIYAAVRQSCWYTSPTGRTRPKRPIQALGGSACEVGTQLGTPRQPRSGTRSRASRRQTPQGLKDPGLRQRRGRVRLGSKTDVMRQTCRKRPSRELHGPNGSAADSVTAERTIRTSGCIPGYGAGPRWRWARRQRECRGQRLTTTLRQVTRGSGRRPRRRAPVVPQNVVRPRAVSRDDGEGEPAARVRSFTCVADGSTSAH